MLRHLLDFLSLLKQANEEERSDDSSFSLSAVVDAICFAGRCAHIVTLREIVSSPAVCGYVADRAPSEKKEAPALPACAL